jgi:hypothetical protein
MGTKIERGIMEQLPERLMPVRSSEISEIMDTLSSIRRIKDEPHQKSTPKRQR